MSERSSSKRRFRLRFSVALLLVVMTVVAAYLGWTYRERRYVAEAHLLIAKPRGELIPGQPPVLQPKAESEERRIIAEALDRSFLERLVKNSNVSGLATIAEKRDPVQWLESVFAVDCEPGSRQLKFRITGVHPEMEDERRILDAAVDMLVFSEELRRRELFAAELEQARETLAAAEQSYVSSRTQLNEAIDAAGEHAQEVPDVARLASEANAAMETVKKINRRIAAIEAEESLDRTAAHSHGEWATRVMQRAALADE